MTARVIDGKALAAEVRQQATERATGLAARGINPGLAVVLVGDNPASEVYVRNKTRALTEAGLTTFDHRLPASTSEAELLGLIEQLNQNRDVDGILVQLPLPAHIPSLKILDAISPLKDVDGFHPENTGLLWSGRPRLVPCTPQGVMVMLQKSSIAVAGKNAVVIGRSNIVGRPMAALLLGRDATVTLCHSKSADLAAEVGRADIVVAAVGSPGLVKGDWIRPGATVIDVGMNRLPGGKLAGDVDYDAAAQVAGAITPVPGGVGPMTIALLLCNTIVAAELRREQKFQPFF